ncbi:GNAT family N-acetyltransferase [Phormidium tenue FACHB-886]|nr:GNAT family N-acetyltransferase [Phormidium tenue FACHB-886]
MNDFGIDDLAFLRLDGDRLILSPLSLEYKDIIFQEFTDEVTRFMYPKPAETIQETEKFIRSAIRSLESGIDLTWVILKKPNREFLGLCALHRTNTNTPEFGIWIKVAAHGQGLGREAIAYLKEWANEYLQYDYLIYSADYRNISSRKIPESLGGQMARSFQLMSLGGQLLDLIEYRIYP